MQKWVDRFCFDCEIVMNCCELLLSINFELYGYIGADWHDNASVSLYFSRISCPTSRGMSVCTIWWLISCFWCIWHVAMSVMESFCVYAIDMRTVPARVRRHLTYFLCFPCQLHVWRWERTHVVVRNHVLFASSSKKHANRYWWRQIGEQRPQHLVRQRYDHAYSNTECRTSLESAKANLLSFRTRNHIKWIRNGGSKRLKKHTSQRKDILRPTPREKSSTQTTPNVVMW